MTDPDADRSGSRGYHASPAPPSPRPSMGGRASRSSLRREHERQEIPTHPRPASVASPPPPPAAATAPIEKQLPSPPPLPTARPPFAPVFTLLASTSHSSNRQTVHHPTVHYIFADDDPETLTAALAHHHGAAYSDNSQEGGGDGPDNPPPDRGILLDMEPTADGSGYEVAWASSLTADWATTSARVSRMEGSGGERGGAGMAAGLGSNFVLKIEGVSIEPSAGALGKTPTPPETEMHSSGGSTGRQQLAAAAPEDYSELLQEFEKRMGTLRKVVEAGAARQRALGDGGVQFSEVVARERAAAPSWPDTGGDDSQSRG